MTARFITLEGGEGAGKSTQIKLLSAHLTLQGIEHITTREPGGAAGAEAIRDLVVRGDVDRWDAKAEALLFMAARQEHIVHTITPALQAGKWVLCDRFFDSTRVYQGIAKGVGNDWLCELYRHCFGGFGPDMTLILDIEPSVGLARTTRRNNNEMRFEAMDIAFHEAVREGFLHIAHNDSKRYIVIDASLPEEQVHHAIIKAVS